MAAPLLAPAPPLHVVFNVRSGRGRAEEVRRILDEECAAAGRELEVLEVRSAAMLRTQAEAAVRHAQASRGVVVVAGGDGTINAVAQSVVGSGCAFGVLPQGTFNYFSRTHGLPSDTREALRCLLIAQPTPVQVGLVNDRVFLVNASTGLYARLLEERESFKRQYGRSRLVALVAAISTLLARGHRLWHLRVAFREREFELRTPTLFVGNNALQLRQVGLPEAEALEHGELAAVALRPVGVARMLWLMLRGAFGRLGESDQVLRLAFRTLELRAARPRQRQRVKVATDGEIGWMDLPLRFQVGPEPLWLMKLPAAPRKVAG